MVKIKYMLLLLAACLLCWQCSSDLTTEIDVDYAGDQLSLVGYIGPDGAHFRVGKTVPEGKSYKLRDLLPPVGTRILVLDSRDSIQMEITAASPNSMLFTGKTKAFAVGQSYRVRAIAPGLPVAETELLTIPPAVEGVQFEPLRPLKRVNGPGGRLGFSFQDAPQEQNFYYMEMGLTYKGVTGYTIFDALNTDLRAQCRFQRTTFPDDCFNGKRIDLQYGFDSFSRQVSGKPVSDSLRVRFGQITRHLFDYAEVNFADPEALIEDLVEPNLTYTNIKNGYGVVFAHNWREYVFALR